MQVLDAFTVQETAATLGVTRARVQAMIEAGDLQATKFGGRWVISANELRRVSRQPREGGRPWSEGRCWDFIRSANRAAMVDNAWRLRRRAEIRRVGVLRELRGPLLRDERVIVGGVHAAEALGAAVTGDDEIDVYVGRQHLAALTSEYDLFGGDDLWVHVVSVDRLVPRMNSVADVRVAWLDLHERRHRGEAEAEYLMAKLT